MGGMGLSHEDLPFNRLPFVLLVTSVLALAACDGGPEPLGRDPASPSAPEVAGHRLSCEGDDRVLPFLCRLFQDRPATLEEALEIYDRFRHLRLQHRNEEERTTGFELIQLIVDENPNPSGEQRFVVSRLTRNLLDLMNLAPLSEQIPVAAYERGFVGVVDAEAGGTFVARNGLASLQVPAGSAEGDFLLVMKPLPLDFRVDIEFDQYPFPFEIETFPRVEFEVPAVLGLCARAPNDVLDRLRIGRSDGGRFEFLPVADPPPGLECDGPVPPPPPQPPPPPPPESADAAGEAVSGSDPGAAGRGDNGLATAGDKDGGSNQVKLAGRRGLGGTLVATSLYIIADPGEEAPTVTFVEFPEEVSNAPGSTAEGTVGFSDAQGDVTRAFFEVISGPFAGAFDFDPDVFGQEEGTFTFLVGCFSDEPCQTGTITLTVELEDAAGNRGAPFAFTFEVVEEEPAAGGRADLVSGRPGTRAAAGDGDL